MRQNPRCCGHQGWRQWPCHVQVNTRSLLYEPPSLGRKSIALSLKIFQIIKKSYWVFKEICLWIIGLGFGSVSKCFLSNHKDLSSVPRTHTKTQIGMLCAYNPSTEEGVTDRSLGLTGQSAWPTLVNSSQKETISQPRWTAPEEQQTRLASCLHKHIPIIPACTHRYTHAHTRARERGGEESSLLKCGIILGAWWVWPQAALTIFTWETEEAE